MMKSKKDKAKGKDTLLKLLKMLQSHNPKLNVTTDQLQYQEKIYETDLESGLEASIQRIPHWLEQFVELNPTGFADIKYDPPLPQGISMQLVNSELQLRGRELAQHPTGGTASETGGTASNR
eukprot:3457529-Rhodomonas_salina.1